jgi:hypothetical protein
MPANMHGHVAVRLLKWPENHRHRKSGAMRILQDYEPRRGCSREDTCQRSLALRPVSSPSRQSDPFVSKASTVSFPPLVASIATGWSDPVAGWELHPLKINTFSSERAHDSRPKNRIFSSRPYQHWTYGVTI